MRTRRCCVARADRLVADADTLIASAAYGGPNRCSDPTIGASVNQLAALGFGVTLANPVGLYMDHLDMTGWTLEAASRSTRLVPGRARSCLG